MSTKQWSASESWAAWQCKDPATCEYQHCARCGHHTGGQGDTVSGFQYDGKWYDLKQIVFFCSEDDMTRAIRERYGHEPWIDEAIGAHRHLFRPDKRSVGTRK